jgi:transposase
MRFIALDVHRDFCEVAIAEPLFAQSLGSDDEVVLEATGNALPIARIVEPYVARVVLANPKAVKGLTQAGPKTDKADARALAGCSPEGWYRRCGRSTSRRGSCVGGSLVARSSSSSAHGRKIRYTRS